MRTLRPGLSGDDPLATIRLTPPRKPNRGEGIVSRKQQKLTTHKKGP